MASSLRNGEYTRRWSTCALISYAEAFVINLTMGICLIIRLHCVYPIYNNSLFFENIKHLRRY